MVFAFKISDPSYLVYMGRDKYENEELLQYAFPEDVWFHVNDLSSAHVYLRMPPGQTDISSIPSAVLAEIGQLSKANSIEGCKQSQVDIVYTLASNLRKSSQMEIGQVGFKNNKDIIHIHHIKRDRDLLKRLEKTKYELKVDLRQSKYERDKAELQRTKFEAKEQRKIEHIEAIKRNEEKDLFSYAYLENIPKEQIPNLKGDGSIESCRMIEEDLLS